ncbi:hypothetical protein K8942_04745 [Candidatus Peribacteria bacterium]|nr:MAG: hypothetical protein K8942_04745 [Candidatus Peribacteria bacterium]
MDQMTPATQTSPWLTISIGLFGLILGYVIVMGQSGTLLSASKNYCPMKQEVCTGEGCNTKECTSGACSKNCPGNCNHAA